MWLLKHLRTGVPTTLPAQDPTSRVFCQGWYGDTGNGRYMSETHAPFWIYGRGTLRLQFAPSRLTPRIRVDGGRSLEVHKRGWHVMTVDVPRLVAGGKHRVGLALLRLSLS